MGEIAARFLLLSITVFEFILYLYNLTTKPHKVNNVRAYNCGHNRHCVLSTYSKSFAFVKGERGVRERLSHGIYVYARPVVTLPKSV